MTLIPALLRVLNFFIFFRAYLINTLQYIYLYSDFQANNISTI